MLTVTRVLAEAAGQRLVHIELSAEKVSGRRGIADGRAAAVAAGLSPRLPLLAVARACGDGWKVGRGLGSRTRGWVFDALGQRTESLLLLLFFADR